MKAATILPLALAILALAACQQAPASDEGPSAAPDEAATSTPSPEQGAREVTLTADGVILVNAIEGRGAATSLSFGLPQAQVLRAMAADFGEPKIETNAECGAGPMEFAHYGALQLNFLDGKLAGWLAERADNLVTADGIRPGMAMGDLEAERQVRMANDTLEGEFAYTTSDGDMFGGFVSPDGTVTSLHTGVNCFFR